MPGLKVGFFGGTFDPIHFGHISLAIQLAEKEGLDEVIFSPSWRSPFKENPVASGEDRLEMTQLAIRDLPTFRVTDYEIRRQTPSYTIEAIRHFHRGSPALFYLFLSEDSASRFFEWKEAQQLLQMIRPLIGVRSSCSVPEALQEGIRGIHRFDISSTEIRERLQKKLYCGHLVPEKVLSYIHKKGLYQ